MAHLEGWIDIVLAWNDEEYRAGLTPDQLAGLPPKPENDRKMTEEELGRIGGGQFLTSLNFFDYSSISHGIVTFGGGVHQPFAPNPGATGG